MRNRAFAGLALAALAAGGCRGLQQPLVPASSTALATAVSHGLARHAIIGFSVDTPRRVQTAARQGITTTILYGGAPPPGSALERTLTSHRIDVVDGTISGYMFYWECHRTHTVAPPPSSYRDNPYCRTDEDPAFDSEGAVLRHVTALLTKDAKLPYVAGHWVLDDWAWWDPGSGRTLLQKVHALIANKAAGLPAICGFGGAVLLPGKVGWDAGTGANYSNGGCDVVGWYNYSPFGRKKPSSGRHLDWSMTSLLPAMAKTLKHFGWNIQSTPLYGIGQAWGGSYENRYYQPGLTRGEMRDQAKAFCDFGATYVGWYAWDDSGFESRTETPNNSPQVGAGIADGIAACTTDWGSR